MSDGAPHPYFPIRPDWLAATTEAALEPDLPIVDAHHHLWTRADHAYLARDFHADVETGGHRVVASVFVECRTNYRGTGEEALQPLGEIEFALREAGSRPLAAGGAVAIAAALVGYADLRLGAAVRAVLEAAQEAGGGRLRAIRNVSVWHPDPAARASALSPPPGLLLDPAFRAGFAQLAPLGLAFEAWLVHTQLAELVDLAERFPGTTLVLNHCGGPLGIGPYADRRAHVMAEWRAALARLARLPNVLVKIGGLGMRWPGLGLETLPRAPTSLQLADEWSPYAATCLDLFGATRCLFESNFPVDKGLASYGVVWNAFKHIAAGASAAEKAAVFAGNAARLYGLTLP